MIHRKSTRRHICKACCWLLLLSALAPATLHAAIPQLLPSPRQIETASGMFDVCQASMELEPDPGASSRDLRTEQLLSSAISRICGHPPAPAPDAQHPNKILFHNSNTFAALPGTQDATGSASREAYTLRISSSRIEITAHSSAGIDYGTQTLLQLMHSLSSAHSQLAAIRIGDWPELAYRGLMIDTAHGARPTMDFMHQLLDDMEAWKLNQLYLYMETNLPLERPTPPWHANAWSREEIRDLVDYAKKRHIDIVPCVELYGHLHDLLSAESQSPMGAMPHGGELNPADPRTSEVVESWMHQLAEMFPSPWLHMGFDEPFELDLMDAASRRNIPPDQLWSEHLRKYAALATALHKRPMFWADLDEGAFLFNKYPQLATQLPPEAIAVPWFYDQRSSYVPLFALFKQHHVPLMVAPAVSDWDDIFPDYETSFLNIGGMITAGRAAGAVGAVNTIWSDSALALHRTAMPGVVYGAAASWQQAPPPADGFFALYAAHHSMSSDTEQLASIYSNLTAAETALKQALGPEPAFRIFDMPFDTAFLQRARAHREKLIKARLKIESAIAILQQISAANKHDQELQTLIAQARCMDFGAMRALYALEIEDNFQALPAHPIAEDLHYRLGWETASRNHSRVGDLIDRAGECLEAYRTAWLSEALPYRLATAEARWQREQQFWIIFQEKVWRARREFKPGDPRPTLDQLLRREP